MQEFTQLKVWQKAHALALAVYQATAGFPKVEMFGVTSQLRRASTSIAANISEGCGRSSDADFARFLHLALGSAFELQYFVLLSKDLEYLPVTARENKHSFETLTATTIEVKRMLTSLIQRIKGT